MVLGTVMAALIGASAGIYSTLVYGPSFWFLKSTILFLTGIISLVLAYGLWRGEKWSWWFGLFVSAVLILTIFTLNFVSFAIGIILAYYLLRKSTRRYFWAIQAQSAMEYLMTYGWAILIIAVVLGALFYLQVFNGGTYATGNSCVAKTGYLCQSAVFSHATGAITVTLGQNTGTNWYSANFLFVPAQTPFVAGLPVLLETYPAISANANTMYGNPSSGLVSGQTVQITLPFNGVTGILQIPVGTTAQGTIWAEYTTSLSPTSPQYAQIGSVYLKAT